MATTSTSTQSNSFPYDGDTAFLDFPGDTSHSTFDFFSAAGWSDIETYPQPHDVPRVQEVFDDLNDTEGIAQPGDDAAGTVDTASEAPTKHEFQCALCSAVFTEKKSLVRHQDTVSCAGRGQVLASQHRCSLCGLTFGRKDDCIRHEKLQHGAAKVSCNVCGRKVATRSLLGHQKTKRCLKEVGRRMHFVPGNIFDDPTSMYSTPLQQVTNSWKFYDPWRLMWKTLTHRCHSEGSQARWPARFQLLTYLMGPKVAAATPLRWNMVAVLTLKDLLLQVATKQIATNSACQDLYPWLHCLTALARMIDSREEAIMHQRHLDDLHDNLVRVSTCPVQRIAGPGMCPRCAQYTSPAVLDPNVSRQQQLVFALERLDQTPRAIEQPRKQSSVAKILRLMRIIVLPMIIDDLLSP